MFVAKDAPRDDCCVPLVSWDEVDLDAAADLLVPDTQGEPERLHHQSDVMAPTQPAQATSHESTSARARTASPLEATKIEPEAMVSGAVSGAVCFPSPRASLAITPIPPKRSLVLSPLLRIVATLPSELPAGSPSLVHPDRHFEELVSFEFGECSIGIEQEIDLDRVAAAIKRRPMLTLALVGCMNDVEDCAIVQRRLQAVKQFLGKRGVECSTRLDAGALEVSARWPLGVVCQLHLDEDWALRDYLCDQFFSDASPRTRDDAKWIDSLFHCCLH